MVATRVPIGRCVLFAWLLACGGCGDDSAMAADAGGPARVLDAATGRAEAGAEPGPASDTGVVMGQPDATQRDATDTGLDAAELPDAVDAATTDDAGSACAPQADLFTADIYRDGFNWTSSTCTASTSADDSACPPPADGVSSYVEGSQPPEVLLDDPECFGGSGGCARLTWRGNEFTQHFKPARGQWAPGGGSNGFFIRHRVKFDADWFSPQGYWHGPQHLKYGRFCRGGSGCNDMMVGFDIGVGQAADDRVRMGLLSLVRQADGSLRERNIFGGGGGYCEAQPSFQPGTWHTVEWNFDLGEPGHSDGQCSVFVDGALLKHESGIDVWGDPDAAVTGAITDFKWIFANTSNAVGPCDTETDHWPPCSTAPETRTLYLDDVCITAPGLSARASGGACAACPSPP